MNLNKEDLLVNKKEYIFVFNMFHSAKSFFLSAAVPVHPTPKMEPASPVLSDSFGRGIDYLRVSVTDRCNERCFYCAPAGYTGWNKANDKLTADEIVATVSAAAGMGFRKIRLTGGEPLVRPDLVGIARRIWEIPGIETLGVSTNGTLLERFAQPLKQAGVRSVNISLDALHPLIYRAITGGDVIRVRRGIEAALNAGFEVVKLNTVLLRGINEGEILPLVDFSASLGCPLRFIELMPMAGGHDFQQRSMSLESAVALLGGWSALEPWDERLGHGPARYWRHKTTGARIGLIGAMTTQHFCGTCNKLRLTSDGKLRPCLGREGEIDLAVGLRLGQPAEPLLRAAVSNKPLDHTFHDGRQSCRPMTAIGG